MFYGAADALLDASMASSAFGKAVKSDPAINLLICYGFLQAIYIQQDAVWTLSRAVGIQWHPNQNPALAKIRDMRNRLTGHPAFAGQNTKRLSSAVISYDHVCPESFSGSIYFEDGFEPVVIDVMKVLNENEIQLRFQMWEIERKMDEHEREFRMEQSKAPLSSEFGRGFDYLLQRLHCNLNDEGRVVQAQVHVKMLRENLDSLKKQLDTRGFGSAAVTDDFHRIFTGLEILASITRQKEYAETDQHRFDLMYDGTIKNIEQLRKLVDDLDEQLRAPVEWVNKQV